LIECEGVSKYYDPKVPVLDQVSFRVEPGEFLLISGDSGAGKSTLMKLLYAEERPTSGRLWVNKQSLEFLKPRQVPHFRRKLGLVLQDLKLFMDRTVWENTAFPLHILETSPAMIREEVHNVLSVLQLEDKASVRIHALSSLDRVRTAIARAIVHHPVCLLADEPFAALTRRADEELFEFLERVNVMGTTICIFTRAMEFVESTKKRVVYLEKGSVKGERPYGGVFVPPSPDLGEPSGNGQGGQP
jgi:cell division transport system ATP-binding protein